MKKNSFYLLGNNLIYSPQTRTLTLIYIFVLFATTNIKKKTTKLLYVHQLYSKHQETSCYQYIDHQWKHKSLALIRILDQRWRHDRLLHHQDLTIYQVICFIHVHVRTYSNIVQFWTYMFTNEWLRNILFVL